MRKLIIIFINCLLLSILLTSCVSKKKYTELMDIKSKVDASLEENQSQVAQLEEDITQLQAYRDSLANAFEEETKKINDELANAKDELMTTHQLNSKLETEMKNCEVETDLIKEKVRAAFGIEDGNADEFTAKGETFRFQKPSPIHYRSGSTRIQADHKNMLNSLASKLKSMPHLKILVAGHTDSVPMKDGARFKDNQELSIARAQNVANELINMGVNPMQLTVTGFGAERPLVQSDLQDATARERNRRTEFILLADATPLLELEAQLH